MVVGGCRARRLELGIGRRGSASAAAHQLQPKSNAEGGGHRNLPIQCVSVYQVLPHRRDKLPFLSSIRLLRDFTR
jgi:hypothetical protein